MLSLNEIKQSFARMSLLENGAIAALLISFFAASFYNSASDIFTAPMVIALFIFFGASVFISMKKGTSIRITAPIIFLVLFWAWIIFSIFFSTVPYVSIYFAYVLSILPLTFFALLSVLRDRKDIYPYAVISLFIWFGFCVWAIIQFFFADIIGNTAGGALRISHPFNNPNTFAGFINIGLVLMTGLYFKIHNFKIHNAPKKWFALFLVFTGVLALLTTQSRTAIILYIGASIALAVFSAVQKQLTIKDMLLWAGALGLAFLLLNFDALGSVINGQSISANQVIGYSAIKNLSSFDVRLNIWTASLQMFLDKPFFGHGLSTFIYTYPSYRLDEEIVSAGVFAHMDPLQFALEMGVLAPVLFYGLVLSAMYRSYRVFKTVDLTPHDAMMYFTTICMLGVVIIHTHFTYHLYTDLILYALAITLVYWHLQTEVHLKNVHVKDIGWQDIIRNKKTAILVFLPLFFVLSIWPVRSSFAIVYKQAAENALAQKRFDDAAKHIAFLNMVAPDSFWFKYKLRADLDINILEELIKANKNPQQQKQLYTRILQELKDAKKYNPGFYMTDYRMAYAHLLSSLSFAPENKDKVEETFKAILERNPFSLLVRLNLARVLHEQERLDEALNLMEQGMKYLNVKDQHAPEYLSVAATLYALSGNESKALELRHRRERIMGLRTQVHAQE